MRARIAFTIQDWPDDEDGQEIYFDGLMEAVDSLEVEWHGVEKLPDEGSVPLVAGDPEELLREALKQSLDAMNVVILDRRIKAWLEENDPKALGQVQDAVRNLALACLAQR